MYSVSDSVLSQKLLLLVTWLIEGSEIKPFSGPPVSSRSEMSSSPEGTLFSILSLHLYGGRVFTSDSRRLRMVLPLHDRR